MVEVLRDKQFLVKEYLETRGLYSHHINSFNTFVDKDLKEIVQQNYAVRSDADPNFYLHFKNVTVGHPQVYIAFECSTSVLYETYQYKLLYEIIIINDMSC